MGFKGLLLSFLGVGAVTGTVVGGYCIFKSHNKTTEKQEVKETPQNSGNSADPVSAGASTSDTQVTEVSASSAPEGS